MSTSKKIAANTLAQLFGKVATMATTIILTILVTRRFGPSGYGDLTLMSAYAALFYVAADFGLNAIAVRELSGNDQEISKYLGNLIGLRFVLALALALIGAAALVAFPYSHFVKVGILISLLTIITQALYTSGNAVFQLKMRYDLSVFAAIVGSLVTLAVALAALFYRGGILLIAASYVFGGVVMVAVSFWLIHHFFASFKLQLDLAFWRRIFITALPLGISTAFVMVLSKADTMILSLVKGSEAVGLYGAAYKIFEVALVFPTFFANSIYPVLVQHLREGRERLVKTATKSGVVLLALGAMVGIVGIFFSSFAIRVIGGVEFGASVLSLRLLLLGMPIFYLSALFLWLLITLGKQKEIPFIYFLGACFNVAANLIFIPHYSFYASSVIMWLSELLILGLLVWRTLHALRI